MREAINKKDINLSFKIFSEDKRGLSFGLTKDQVIVGKNKNCDVVLDNEQYSDYEIIFFKTKEGNHFAKPLHHYEELLINGRSNVKKGLKEGDMITFGPIEGILEKNEEEMIEEVKSEKSDGPPPFFKEGPDELKMLENQFVKNIENLDKWRANPLEKLEFDFLETKKVNRDIQEDELFKKVKLKREFLEIEIYSSGNLIYNEVKSLKKGDLKITGKKNKKSAHLVIPFLEGEEKYPFIKKVKNGEILYRPLPELKVIKEEKSLKENRLTEWEALKKGESVCFVKGCNHLVITLKDEKRLVNPTKLLTFNKSDSKVFLVGLFITLILFLIANLFYKKEEVKEKKIISETLISFNDSNPQPQTEKLNKKPQLISPQKNQKIIKPKTKTRPIIKKVMKKKKVRVLGSIKKKRDQNKLKKAFDHFLKKGGPKLKQMKKRNDFTVRKRGALNPNLTLKKVKFGIKTGGVLKGKNHFKEENLSKKIGSNHLKKEVIDISKRTVLLGALDPEVIRKILMKHLHQFKFCYQQELAFNKFVLGTTTNLNFLISPLGSVKKVKLHFKGKAFTKSGKKCLTKVLKGMTFPKPKGGGVVRVKQPLNFSKDFKRP